MAHCDYLVYLQPTTIITYYISLHLRDKYSLSFTNRFNDVVFTCEMKIILKQILK